MKDLISRQAAIDALRTHERKALHKWFDNQLDIEWNNAIDICCYDIEDLPSAQPERKRGKWIEDDDGWDEVIWRCSECDAVFTLVDGTPKENEYYFCPHCGADMRGEQDE